MAGPEALAKLLDGNRRFASGERLGSGPVQLAVMVGGQNPIAAVLRCADSRVPPEHVLDQG
jgi:carbonic anhydrase